MAVKLEINFMNNLSPSLRRVAGEVYLRMAVDELVACRLQESYEDCHEPANLNAVQWVEILDALILTKISQLKLGKHLTIEQLSQLNYIVRLSLKMQEKSVAETVGYLEENAKTFSEWYKTLIKLMNR